MIDANGLLRAGLRMTSRFVGFRSAKAADFRGAKADPIDRPLLSRARPRNNPCSSVALAWLLGVALGAEALAAPPLPVDKSHQLMLDDRLLESLDGVARIVNQPVKCHDNPVLTYERPWEGNCVILWGSVLYDPHEKRFQMWYESYKKFPPKGEPYELLCYATSRDGLQWDRPELRLIAYRGSTANNIVMTGPLDAPTVLRNPNPTAENRYLLYYYRGSPPGIRRSTSADGLRWKHEPEVLVAAGDRNAVTYDLLHKKFYLITRPPERKTPGRACGLWQSDDGRQFGYRGEIAAADRNDPPGTEFYGMIPFRYEGLLIGWLEPFYVPQRKLDTQLMFSRDGRQWHRAADRQIFLPWGPPGSWDQAWVTPSHNPPIRVGDKLYIFYQGRNTLHWATPPFGHIGSIGLAFLRPDGFVSVEPVQPVDPSAWKVDAGQKPDTDHRYRGTATTARLLLTGTRLHLNAIARPGTIRVALLDAESRPVPGFTADDCQPMSVTDSLDYTVRWRGAPSLAQFDGKPVRLRFYLQGAKLYSFWME